MAMPGPAHDNLIAVGRGAVIQFIGIAASSLSGLGTIVVVSRRLGYDDLGLYALGFGSVFVLSLLLRLGLDTAAIHACAVHVAQGQPRKAAAAGYTCVGLTAILGLLGTAILFLAAPVLADLFGEPHLTGVIRAYSPGVFLFGLLHVASSVLRGAGRIGAFVAPRFFVYPLAQLLLTFAFLHRQTSLLSAVAASVAAMALGAALALILLALAFSPALRGAPTAALVRFGIWNGATQALQVAASWADIVIVGILLASTDVGFYRAAAQTALLLTLPGVAFEALYAPVSARLLANRDLPHLRELTQGVTRLIFLPTGVLALAAVLVPDLVLLPFGPNIGPASAPFMILVVAHTLSAALGPSPYILIMGGRPRDETLSNLLGLVVAIAVGWPLTISFGILGAAAATACGSFGRDMARLVFLWRHFHITPFSPALSVGAIWFTVSLLLAHALNQTWPSQSLLIGTAVAATFLVATPVFVLTAQDRHAVFALARSFFFARPAKEPTY